MIADILNLSWLRHIAIAVLLCSTVNAGASEVSINDTSRPFYGTILVKQIKDAAASITMDLFPNPPAGEIHVKLGQTESGFRLRLLDKENGKEHYNESAEGFRRVTLDISELERGTYHLHLLDASSRSLKIFEIILK